MKTFEQIAPEWAKAIKAESVNITGIFHTLDMDSYECCIVGEAYGFMDDYSACGFDDDAYCEECDKFASDFALKIVQEESGDLILYDSYTTFITQFEQHWNEKHEST